MSKNEMLDATARGFIQRVGDSDDESLEFTLGEGVKVQTEIFYVVNLESKGEDLILRKASPLFGDCVLMSIDIFQGFLSTFVRHESCSEISRKLSRHEISQDLVIRRKNLVDWDAHL